MKVVLSVFVIAAIFLYCSCGNNSERKSVSASDTILGAFKKIDQSLNASTDQTDYMVNQLYRAIFNQLTGHEDSIALLTQMNVELSKFYDVVDTMQFAFKRFCGDPSGSALPEKNEGNFSLTNKFFMDGEGRSLYYLIKDAKAVLDKNATSAAMHEMISEIAKPPLHNENQDRLMTYIENVPPVAAITIMNKFVADIRNAEIKVLQDRLTPQ